MAGGNVIITDGSIDFSGGVDSIKCTTIASEKNPNGLGRNQLAWLDNATVRDGGIFPRGGWQPLGQVYNNTGLFQGKFLYQPIEDDPYFIYSVSGRILLVRCDGTDAVDLSARFGLTNPPTEPIAFFEQAEMFLIIQAGDNVTLPLFWDGATLRRSKGITNTSATPGTPGVNEIPAGTAMDYFMGRLWYAQGRTASAGDIVDGNSGTAAYDFKDAVLNVTECPLVLAGDGFSVPAQDGTIRGLKHSANIDAALGQGRLFMGTRKAIYALNVPVSRADWIATTNSNQPLVTVVQINSGWVNDRGIVTVNGDLFYQSLEPAIRSLNQSLRYFGQWGNKQISNNENRILQYNDRALLRFCSGIYFDNRMLQTALPTQVEQGVIHRALIPMDFIPISSFGPDVPPNWEGMYEGLDFYQVASGDFGGRERAFATIRSRDGHAMELWEITANAKDDTNQHGLSRITWIMEFPAFTWGDEFSLKKLTGAEIWIDRLFGTVEFSLEYRPDGQACWILWHQWKKCSPRNSTEDEVNPTAYPLVPCLESYFNSMTLPVPPEKCAATNRPSTWAYQQQCRLVIKGFCRVRGFYLHGEQLGRKLYENITC
jgi:hypothetical protein